MESGQLEPLAPPPVMVGEATRLHALSMLGLSSAPDPGMEHYAQRVRDRLGVPVSLVSLVEADRQVFPGMVGLPEPWATARCTPLSHSFCQYVVATGQPLIIGNAREHPWVSDNPAIAQLGVVAYVGMPLTDDQGQVLGSLCAIDTTPRDWSTAQLETLADLAHGASMELRLRGALSRSHTLLAVSQSLAQVSTVTDIRVRVGELMSTELAPTYVGMIVLGPDGQLHRISDPCRSPRPDYSGRWKDFALDAPQPDSTAVRERRVVHYRDRETLLADYPDLHPVMVELGLEAVTTAPMMAGPAPLGALILGWDQPREPSSLEPIVITSIAEYAAQALVRVQLLQHRISVAHDLQRAMLAELPTVEGLALGARYLPADSREQVGGDWYDVTPLPTSASAGRDTRRIAVSVGDIVGHDVHAATIMGQVRSMLRQAFWSREGESPAAAMTDLELACAGVGLHGAGTAVLARLEHTHEYPPRWEMTWSNAGQCPPVLLHPDGHTVLLTDHDIMLGYGHLTNRSRRDYRVTLEAGSTLLLYTDGLVEIPGRTLDAGIAELRKLLSTLRGRTPQDIVDTVIKTLVTDAHDDTVALAITVTDPPENTG